MSIRDKPVWVSIAIVVILATFFLGVLVGRIALDGVAFEPKLTMDGASAAIIALLALIASAIIVPALIQPLFRKRNSMNAVANEMIKKLSSDIEDMIGLLTEIYDSKANVTLDQRKQLVAVYSKVVNYANIVKNQSGDIAALSSFEKEVYQPLTNAKSNFTEKVLPRQKVSEAQYLLFSGELNEIIYKLIDLRYKVN